MKTLAGFKILEIEGEVVRALTTFGGIVVFATDSGTFVIVKGEPVRLRANGAQKTIRSAPLQTDNQTPCPYYSGEIK